MPTRIKFEANGFYVLHLGGTLKQSEFAALQSRIAQDIDTGAKPRVLAILENFEGWEKGADWDDLDFALAYSGEITRIAIVGEPMWEAHALAFAGAGVRNASVRFFPPEQLAEAQ